MREAAVEPRQQPGHPVVVLPAAAETAWKFDFGSGEPAPGHVAVKAGDRLTSTEIDALLDLRERIERGTACPHGRPTALRITMRDLERNFGRA